MVKLIFLIHTENAVYSCYGQNEGVQFYDEIQAKNVTDSKEHTYDYASASADQEHTYEHGFVSSVDVGAVYDNAYAEIGPFQEVIDVSLRAYCAMLINLLYTDRLRNSCITWFYIAHIQIV